MRVGVGRPSGPMDTAAYVLQKPPLAEQTLLEAAVALSVEALQDVFTRGLMPAMNRYNAKTILPRTGNTHTIP